MALPVTRKAMAYITHNNRLLVFRQPEFPEAGMQVPGGSIDPGERPEDAVLREAFEETGLSGLTLGAFLGDVQHDLSPRGRYEIHHRYYFHLRVEGDILEAWQHTELYPSEGDHESVLFEFFWAELPDGVPPLIGHRGEKIPELLIVLGFA
ncbi:MAG: NUDIX domain-containing protein [Chloroflexota bacterium]|nr:NUDIX domain-containing protein [Chloroflexota bacterium]